MSAREISPIIRVGSVPYLNSWPLTQGLGTLLGHEVQLEVPSQLVSRLRLGPSHPRAIEVGLVSTIELFSQPGYRMVKGLGVASRGPVHSVRLYHRKPLDHGIVVSLDTSSRSSQALTRISLESILGLKDIKYRNDAPTIHPVNVQADAILRIGDPTLSLADIEGFESLDLGELWQQSKNLPFVYAVWIIAKEAQIDEVAPKFHQAYQANRLRLGDIAQQGAVSLGIDPQVAHRYLTEHIHYELDDTDLLGLRTFRDEASRLGLIDGSLWPPGRSNPAITA